MGGWWWKESIFPVLYADAGASEQCKGENEGGDTSIERVVEKDELEEGKKGTGYAGGDEGRGRVDGKEMRPRDNAKMIASRLIVSTS